MMDTTEIVTSDTCNHPKLASWNDILEGGHHYQCMECGKEIHIPALTLAQGRALDESGIVGLAFGERWREKMMSGDQKRRWA